MVVRHNFHSLQVLDRDQKDDYSNKAQRSIQILEVNKSLVGKVFIVRDNFLIGSCCEVLFRILNSTFSDEVKCVIDEDPYH